MKTLHIISAVAIICVSAFQMTGKEDPKKKAKVQPASNTAVQPVTGANAAIATSNSVADIPKIFPYRIHQSLMPNGLNVVTVPYQSPGIAAFYIVVRVGSRNEVESGKTGFAHFFEHMMFRGTESYPKDKYSEVLKSTGASANANTSLDRTLYHMTGDASKLETMFMLEADRFKNLSYSVQDFKTEAGAVKGEYTKNSANPLTKLNEMTQNTAFEKHTYKHTTMGFFEDIVDMPNQYDYSREFFSRYYRPEYSTIIVVGDVTPEKINKLAVKYFVKIKSAQTDVIIKKIQVTTINFMKPNFATV